MTTPKADINGAIATISEAIKSGSLPSNTEVRWSGPHITVTIDTQDYYRPDFKEMRLMSELFATSFSGGETRRMQCIHRGKPRRKIPAKDRMEYRAGLAHGTILLRYVAEHECREFRGSASSGSAAGGENPEWNCRGCGRRLTITESRRLGLLPPLVKGRKP
jgi:hypothetical protein